MTGFPMADPIIVHLEYTPPGEAVLPGARDGKPMLFKIWKQSEEREADAEISLLITGTAVFSEGSVVAV